MRARPGGSIVCEPQCHLGVTKMSTRLYLACLASVIMTGCAEREPPPDVEDTVFADQVKALEKGKSVEDTVEEQARKQREAIEAAEGGSSGDN